MSLRSPLARVLGKGSAKEGTEHWWMQRLTAAGLLILGLWFLVSFAGIDAITRASLAAWAADPLTAGMLLALGLTLAWHSSLGVQVVIEDYVHGPALKVTALVLNRFAHVALGIGALLAALKLVLGDAA